MSNDMPAIIADAPVSAAPQPGVGLMSAESARVVAEAQGQMLMARQFPRDIRAARERIAAACRRPTLAAAATFTYSRGGTEISGPTIRLAEAIAQDWGNISFGTRELSRNHRESVIQAYACDLETGTRAERTFTVPHVRYTREHGSTPVEDPRDIYEVGANQGARRQRACLQSVIPGYIWEDAVALCDVTLRKTTDVTPEGVAKLVTAFGEFGVTKEQIQKRIQRSVDSIRPAQVISLRKIYTSLKDGMSAPGDWFEPEAPAATEAPGAPGEPQAAAAGDQADTGTEAPAGGEAPPSTFLKGMADAETLPGLMTRGDS